MTRSRNDGSPNNAKLARNPLCSRVMRKPDPELEIQAQTLVASARYSTELPDDFATALTKDARRMVLRKGAFLHRKGDPAIGAYQLLTGSIRVSTTNAEGSEVVLTDLKPGAFFGEISLFDELPRTHDARAIERSEVLLITPQHFHALLAQRPALATHFLRVLSAKLRLCFAVIEAFGMQRLEQRLALRLLWLAEQHAPSLDAPIDLGVVSQADLAAMVGATRQSVNKELQALQRNQRIQLSGRRVIVLDVDGLRRMAGI